MMRLIPVFIAFLLLFISTSAHALCSSPPGAAGDQIYNSSHNVMQYCNGNQWIAMGSGGGGGSGSDTLGNLSCNNGESVEYDGTNWNCVGGKVSRTGDTMTGTLTLSPPTAGTHAATKAYVDTAIAGVAGASGGGAGTTCMYFSTSKNASCPAGWAQAGDSESYNTGTTWHRVCCMGGGSLLDEMPATFDFPASPAIAGTAGHTWSPLEITGFDSASVSIATTPGSGIGEFRICSDSACSNVLKGWGVAATGIASGNYLQIRINAHTNTRSQNPKITITVGGMSDDAPITSTIPGNYFLAFITNATFNGNLGNVGGADTKCQNAATAAGFSGTFRAWLATGSSATVPATRFENTGTTAAFYMPNGSGGGIKLVDNWADLTDGSLDVVFNRTETGSTASASYVWSNVVSTGTGYVQASSSYTCSAYGSGADTSGGSVGRSDQTSGGYWTNYNGNTRGCDDTLRLYCFQTVLPN